MSKPLRKIIAIILPWAPMLLLATVIALTASYLEGQATPLMIRTAVDQALIGPQSVHDWKLYVLLSVAMLGTQALKSIQRFVAEWPSTRLQGGLFRTGILHLLSHQLSWLKLHHTAEVQSRLTNSTGAITDLVKITMTDVLPPLLSLILATRLIWVADRIVGIAVMVTIPIYTIITVWQSHNQSGVRVSLKRAKEMLGVRVSEVVHGLEEVKLYHAEHREADQTAFVCKVSADNEFRHHAAMAMFDLAKGLVERSGFLVILILSLVFSTLHGLRLGPGGIMMLLMLYEKITEPAKHFHRLLDEYQEKWVAAKDLLKYLNIEPIGQKCASARETRERCVIFDCVDFSYPGAEEAAVSNLSLYLPAGGTTALIGPSGCGKTTLARLLTGLYVPDRGKILIGEENVSPIEKQTAHIVGMLTQQPYIFRGTLAENARFGCPEASQEDTLCALRMAGLGDLVLQKGIDFRITQNGDGLSGGERQRLALARLILQGSDVVVFDEPSSALDPTNARRFFYEVLSALKGKTIIVITHQTEDLGWADRVLEMENGRVIRQFGPNETVWGAQNELLLPKEKAFRI